MYRFTATTEEFNLGEVAAPILSIETLNNGEFDRVVVPYFFGAMVLVHRNIESMTEQTRNNARKST